MSRDTDLAWVAGIIDGEGCISLRRARTGFDLRVVVMNTSVAMVRHLQEVFPESRVRLYHYGTPKWRPRFEWVIQARKAEAFLREILQYLVNKKPEAELALYSRSLIGKRGSRHNPHTAELYSIVDRLKDMKRRA